VAVIPTSATFRSVSRLLSERAMTHPDRLFMWSGADKLTYSAMDQRMRRVANGLSQLGIRKGDRVATITQNRTEVLDLFFACSMLGAVQVPLNAFLKGEFLRYQLADSEARILFADAEGRQSAAGLLDAVRTLETVVLFDGDDAGDSTSLLHGARHYGELLRASPDVADVSAAASDTMSILYTSGSTGFPKGCILSHAYCLNAANKTATAMELGPEDVLITALPMYHAAAQIQVVMTALLLGVTGVVEHRFSGTQFMARAAETKATVAHIGVGAAAKILLAQPESERDKVHQLRLFFLTAIDIPLQNDLTVRFGAAVNVQIYGQTECILATYTPGSESRSLTSVGRCAPDVDIRIVDEQGETVGNGETGEMLIRPRIQHSLFDGYWKRAEDTLRAFRNLWYHTGDLFRSDDAGFLYFVDRKRESMRRRGENVSSAELESAISAHPQIEEVAVHAVPSELTEDDIKACIVLARGATVEPGELLEYFRSKLPYFAIPRYVEVLASLPRNALARVMKEQLRERGITPETWDLEKIGAKKSA
jgi:carnitine-CoA ligase